MFKHRRFLKDSSYYDNVETENTFQDDMEHLTESPGSTAVTKEKQQNLTTTNKWKQANETSKLISEDLGHLSTKQFKVYIETIKTLEFKNLKVYSPSA